MSLNVVLMIFWNFQKIEEDIGVAVKAKTKEIILEKVMAGKPITRYLSYKVI